jgi:hypothetical protein
MMGDRTVIVQSAVGDVGGAVSASRSGADAALSGGVFMVASSEQLESAKAVARHLPFASYAFNPYTDLTLPLADIDAVERALGFVVTQRAIAAVRRAVRGALALAGPRAVLVAGQDEGTLERAAMSAARAAGARLVMMPDGIPTNVKVLPPLRRRPAWLAKNLLDRALVGSRVLVGRRSDLFSSNPDLVLSWGRGWDAAIRRAAPDALIADCGSPRSDGLAAIPPPPGVGNILVCSQPLLLPQHDREPLEEDVAVWYSWLSELWQAGDARVRVRLHPGERVPRYRLPSDLSPLAAEPPRPVLDDIGWADTVIAPYSTVLVEAVGAGRVPMTAGGTLVWGRTAANAFLEDPRVACMDFRRSPRVDELVAAAGAHAADAAGLREDYMAHIGRSAERSAEAIAAVGRG